MTVVASNYERKENDLYQTEPWATEALLKYIDIKNLVVWECCAGNHLMADVLKEAQPRKVYTSDIAQYNKVHDFHYDFEKDRYGGLPELGTIISNPPYGKGNRLATKFVELSLERCNGIVAMLLTAKWDFGKTRQHLTKNNLRFFGKINLVDRIQWFPGETSGTEDHAWYIWNSLNNEYPKLMYAGK
jgi:hypothetical protein